MRVLTRFGEDARRQSVIALHWFSMQQRTGARATASGRCVTSASKKRVQLAQPGAAVWVCDVRRRIMLVALYGLEKWRTDAGCGAAIVQDMCNICTSIK